MSGAHSSGFNTDTECEIFESNEIRLLKKCNIALLPVWMASPHEFD